MAKIVVFGANSAVAQACARRWVELGHELFLVGRDPKKLEALVADLRVRSQSKIASLACDLADTHQHPGLFQTILAQLGRIDTIFVAHGVLGENEVASHSFAATKEILDINLMSPISLLTLGAEILEKNGRGSIAAITSVAGDRGRKSNYIYGTSKGALSIFLSGLGHRLAPKTVSVTDIKLGFVDTPMTQSFKKGLLWQKPEQVAKKIVKAIERHKGVAYVPGFWRLIMFIIKSIPDKIFKRLSI